MNNISKGRLTFFSGGVREADVRLSQSETVGQTRVRRLCKFGAPQAGKALKGYRLDPPHTGNAVREAEKRFHFDYWDYTGGKRGEGSILMASGVFLIVHS